MEIIERRRAEREQVVNRALEYARSLKFRCSVFLIGSYARGDFNLWSDVDIIIVGDFAGNPVYRLKNLDFPSGFEIIPFTRAEIISSINKKRKFVEEISLHHVVLRDDLSIGDLLNR